ncbi:MAG: hypothetical protein WCO69_02160 [Candidatus Omnitrophota bacterium]
MKSFIALFIAMGVLFFFSASAQAAAKTWDGGGADNNWSTPANWSGNTVPGTNDSITFDNTSVKDCTIDALGTWSGGTFAISVLYSGIITQNVPFTATSFTMAGGTFIANNTLQVASFPISGGALTIADGVTATSSTFTQSGGTVTVGTTAHTANLNVTTSGVVRIGATLNGTGTVTIGTVFTIGNPGTSAGTVNIYNLYVGTNFYMYYASNATINGALTTGNEILLFGTNGIQTLTTGTSTTLGTNLINTDTVCTTSGTNQVYFNNGPSTVTGVCYCGPSTQMQFGGPFVHTFTIGSIVGLTNAGQVSSSLKFGGTGTNASNMTVFRSDAAGFQWYIRDYNKVGVSLGPWADFKDMGNIIQKAPTCANCTDNGNNTGTYATIFNPQNYYWRGTVSSSWTNANNWRGAAGTYPLTNAHNAIFPDPDPNVYSNNCLVDGNVYPHSIQMVSDMTLYGSTPYAGTLNWGTAKTIQIDGDLYNQNNIATTAGTSIVKLQSPTTTTDNVTLGSNNFYDLVIYSGNAARNMYFESGKTQIISHALTMDGSSGKLLQLQPSGSAVWGLSAPAVQQVNWVKTWASNACSSIAPVSGGNLSEGNTSNTNWVGLTGELLCSAISSIFFGSDF